MPSTDLRLRALARRQHGVFLLRQIVDLGVPRSTIRRRIEGKVWEEVMPRVYRSSVARRVDWRQMAMGLTLVTNGVASGPTAAALYGFLPPPELPEVIAPRPSRLGLPAAVHITAELPPCDVTVVGGIPATTPARTLIDMGGRLSLLEQRHPELAHAANLWEAKVLRVVRALGLPDPRVNYRVQVGGKRRYIDLAWPEAKVAVEFDGFVPHSTRRVFDDDRARQNDLVADRWTVFRVTKTMLDSDPAGTFRPIVLAVTRECAGEGPA